MISLPCPIAYPPDGPYVENGYNNSLGLSATNPKMGLRFGAIRSGSVPAIWYRAGASASQPVKIGLQTANSAGAPSGTWLDYVTLPSIPVALTTSRLQFSSPVSLTRNVLYWMVAEWDSTAGTASVVRSHTDLGWVPKTGSAYNNHAWGLFVAATSTWTIGNHGTALQALGIEYDSGNWFTPLHMLPASVSLGTGATFSSASTPNERGNKVVLPACSVCGLQAFSDLDGDSVLCLYDEANNVIASGSPIAPASRWSTSATLAQVFFPSVEIPAGTYRVALKPTTTTSISHWTSTYGANQINGLAMGADCCSTSRKDSGSWTDLPNSIMAISVLVNGFPSGASGFPLSRVVH